MVAQIEGAAKVRVSQSKDDQGFPRARAAALIMLGLFVGWGYFAASETQRFGSGTYGDSFGVVTSLASLLAVLLGLWSLATQQEELAQSTEALARQRMEADCTSRLQEIEISYAMVSATVTMQSASLDRPLMEALEDPSRANSKSSLEERFSMYLGRIDARRTDIQLGVGRLAVFEKELPPVEPADELATVRGASKRFGVRALAAATLGALTIYGLWFYAALRRHEVGSGEFGDAFGSLTGSATAIAVVLALAAVELQLREVRFGRTEMAAHRRAIRRQNVLRCIQLHQGYYALYSDLVVQMIAVGTLAKGRVSAEGIGTLSNATIEVLSLQHEMADRLTSATQGLAEVRAGRAYF